MSGWDEARKVTLAPPWEDFWLRVRSQVEIGYWLDFQEAWYKANQSPTAESIAALLAYVRDLVVEHNCTNRDGVPIDFGELRGMSSGLIRAVAQAISAVVDGGGETETEDPLETPVRLRGRSSRGRKSRRGLRSTA